MNEETATARPLSMPDYLPRTVADTSIGIGLIGCGFISEMHLAAYRAAGYNVVALCDRTLAKAEFRRDEFFPPAAVTDSVGELLDRDDVQVIDIATHVNGRPELIRRALRSGHHVLSQKPFVRSLDEGLELVDLARAADRILAVNHNGRWAPHFAAAIELVRRGDIGDVVSADFAVYWPHDQNFADDPHFSTMEDLIVYDFGIHWFDVVAQLLARSGSALNLFAAGRRRPGAAISVPTDVEVLVQYEHAAATLLFRAASPRIEAGSFRIEGTKGTILHSGESLGGPALVAETESGAIRIDLEGSWFANGMLGAMSEVLWAIGERTRPSNDAATALAGLELAFAAQESLRTGAAVVPGSVRTQAT
jgi:predicted dehydrogenase